MVLGGGSVLCGRLGEAVMNGVVCVCVCVCVLIAQSCPTFCDSMDCNLPDSSVHGIPQARRLEWVAVSFSDDRG